MNFANPAALLGLLPLWGFVFFLYFLRVRRRQVRISGAFLWPEHTESVRADAPFQKLQWSLLLLLQLILCLLLILMLARPQFPQQGLLSESTVFVVDASASMKATDVAPSRFDSAVSQLQKAVETKSRAARIAIIEAGVSTRIAAGLTSDEVELGRAVRGLAATDAESDMGEAMRLAAAISRNQPGAKIVLLSDGVFPDIAEFSAGRVPVAFSPIGDAAGNAYFKAFAAGTNAAGSGLLVSVEGTFGEARKIPLEVKGDGETLARLEVNLKPGEAWTRTIPLKKEVVKLEGRLDLQDGLESDNLAFAIGPDRSAIRVLLVSSGNMFLERALALDPRVTVDRASGVPEGEKGKGKSSYDLVIFDELPEEAVRAPYAVTFGRPLESGGISIIGTYKPAEWSFTQTGPLTEGTTWPEVYIESGHSLKVGPGAKALVQTKSGPLLVESTAGTTKRLILPFKLLDSDFPLQPSFPILISNIVTWASAQGASQQRQVAVIKPGQPWMNPGWQRGTLFKPDGKQESLTTETGSLRLTNLSEVGWYRLREGERTAELGMSLVNSKESILTPGNPQFGAAGGTILSPLSEQRFGDIWRWVALLALCIFCLEWWVYARKS